ncbi:protein of unknown function [Georgenia satyanarayanai]|uniref:DUF4282 domain-containing protein n=1 Tax=Georgenia satyanarayanai TaxID=860221 RepID=A0A2Y9C7N0_9MICO|nr:DUF4282 domain-containing protein [Georgenia satyanarayanai]PYF97382.1 uncharacterized protein DUF4282 [Georgenia satyanarayanai]SSA46163.1 protein of unknown function [Georgenia satyanarayanai]
MSTPPPSPYQPPQGQPGQVPPPPPAYPQPQQQQGQQQWGYGAPGAPQAGPQGESPKNFFAALLDWKFHTLITPKLVSWVYLAVMILSALYWLFLVFASFAADPVFGVLVLLIGPIVLLVSLAFFRMTLEFYFALVRMSDDIHRSQGLPRS